MIHDYVITFHDGIRLRSLHPQVLSETDRSLIERLIKRQVERLARMENGLPRVPESFPESMVYEQMDLPKPSGGTLLSYDPISGIIKAETAKASGYSGDVCTICHGFRLKRTGTCVTCEDCHQNEGCG